MDPVTVSIGGFFLWEIFVIEHVLSAFVGMILWKNKRGDPSGAVILCAILGILGVIILAIARPREREIAKGARSQGRISCPHCAELIMHEAHVCPHCGRDVTPAPQGAT